MFCLSVCSAKYYLTSHFLSHLLSLHGFVLLLPWFFLRSWISLHLLLYALNLVSKCPLFTSFPCVAHRVHTYLLVSFICVLFTSMPNAISSTNLFHISPFLLDYQHQYEWKISCLSTCRVKNFHMTHFNNCLSSILKVLKLVFSQYTITIYKTAQTGLLGT